MSAPSPTATPGDPWWLGLLSRHHDPDAGVRRQGSGGPQSLRNTGSTEDAQVLNSLPNMLCSCHTLRQHVDILALSVLECQQLKEVRAWRGRCSTNGRRSTCPAERRIGSRRLRTNVECRHRPTSGWQCSAGSARTKLNASAVTRRGVRLFCVECYLTHS